MIPVESVYSLLTRFNDESDWNQFSETETYKHLGFTRSCGDYDLMQFSGPKDKNGKEIYEGDIVETIGFQPRSERSGKPFTGEVEWSLDHWRVRHSSNEQGLGEWGQPDLEVIGNIYQNPELLKKT